VGWGQLWRQIIGEVGREVTRSASIEIPEHVSQALLKQVHEVLGTSCRQDSADDLRERRGPSSTSKNDDDER
jgi:hypothetical protein